MAEEFEKSVEDGLKLSKRIYFGKDRAVAPPKLQQMMNKSTAPSLLPKSPMVYAVITDPRIVDNPDLPSYQPHVHGRCDPPALIPLQMNRIELQSDSYLDTAFITVTGSWRIHCVMGNRSCDCRIAIPMGEQGSILGFEVEVPRKSYRSRVIMMEDIKDAEKTGHDGGGFIKPHIFTFTIPKVDGGSNLCIKVSWSQKILSRKGHLSLSVPFSFPQYVTPAGKKFPKKERITVNVNAGPGIEVTFETTTHPLKKVMQKEGKLGFSYESEVISWSKTDFSFSYAVTSSHASGGVLLQSPSTHDVDQREMFCMYLYPENPQRRKVCRKSIVFLVDKSSSMQGKLCDDVKTAISSALSKLDPEDLFNIIAFNSETYLFSASMETATEEAVNRAVQWININFNSEGGTNILLPMTKAIEMLSNPGSYVPIIFLVTDGAVEDERYISDQMKNIFKDGGSIHPRIYTFGIGSFCNHYFLRMLATIGRGLYDGAHDLDLVAVRMQKLFYLASSASVVNITFATLDDLDEVEVYPPFIPDLSSESLLTVSGRYKGNFPKILQAKGLLADLSNCVIDLKVQQEKDIPLDQVLAKVQIEQLTAQAWFSENKQLEKKVAKMSLETGVMSEYTRMVMLENGADTAIEPTGAQKISKKSNAKKLTEPKSEEKLILLQYFGIGFGNLAATTANIPPGKEEPKLPEAAEIFVKAASNCCGSTFGYCCCPCCIQACSNMNNQCAIMLAQLCTALACFGCLNCCAELCCTKSNG